MIPIILLNWNGFTDTIECLKSIYSSTLRSFSIVIVDNNSTDDSISHIINYLISDKIKYKKIEEGLMCDKIDTQECIIYSLNHNYGFAKANNMALELIKNIQFDYFLLLNNDTIVEPQTLEKLKDFLDKNIKYDVVTPQIRYWDDKNMIWNCGGRLLAGFRKYYYAKKHIKNAIKNLDITFITGCALLGRRSIILNNKIFTELFFFGEEDFDFSLRMKKEKRLMKCVVSSILYHKVSSSCKHQSRIPKMYIHYLNRYINMRNHHNPKYYIVWRAMLNIHIYSLLLRRKYPLSLTHNFYKKLNADSEKLSEVNSEYYHHIMTSKW